MGEPRQHLFPAVIVGVAAGFLSGLFGVGGGILIVPGLVLLMRMEQRIAHGTSLASIIAIAPFGVLGFALDDQVDWAAAAVIAAGAICGAVAGTALLYRLSQRVLRIGFALFLVAAALRLLVNLPDAQGRGSLDVFMAFGLVLLGLLSGTAAGLLGVGGGIVIIPVLVIFLAIPDATAKGTSLAVIIPTAIVGTWRNLEKRNARLDIAAVVGLTGAGAAFGGSQLAVNLDPRLSSVLFAVLLLVVAVQLFARRVQPAGAPAAE